MKKSYLKKKNERIIILCLFLFASFSAILIGEAWDEGFHLEQGKITFNYLITFGKINTDLFLREYYSPIYWTLSFLLADFFPQNYREETIHILNMCVSFGTLFGTSKIFKELFNKNVSKIIFVILFFFPLFFVHMGINGKDTILAFSHVWIFYFLIRYFKVRNNEYKKTKYIIHLSMLISIASGIQLLFIGSLIPIIFILIIDYFYYNNFINKKIIKKKLLIDIFKCILLTYFTLILFWIDVHPNIIRLPFNFIFEIFSDDFWTGYPFNLINGKYIFSANIPKDYLLINFFYKTPEYILISYLLFFVLFLKIKKFFEKIFLAFNQKLFFIIFILFFPNLIILFFDFPIYDGLRLFIWVFPYFCMIPALTIYYFIVNFKLFSSKIFLSIIGLFFLLLINDFIKLTPFQYTYLNNLNGNYNERYAKFENDYWGTTIKELIKKTKFKNQNTVLLTSCGLNTKILEKYLTLNKIYNYIFVSSNKASYVIMTNRVTQKNDELISCFDKFKGEDISTVKRNKLILSVVRKIN